MRQIDLPKTHQELTAWRLSIPTQALDDYLSYMSQQHGHDQGSLAPILRKWITELLHTAADTVSWKKSHYMYDVIDIMVLDVRIGTAERSYFYDTIKSGAQERA
jgi:hypothetical protein